MDPLSILAGVAGVATAGSTVVSALFTLFKSVRNAPKEMRDIAAEMSILTSLLEHLHETLTEGKHITKRRFLRDVKQVVRNIQATQRDIFAMIHDRSILSRLRWGRQAKRLLSDIEKHKVTINLQVSVLSLAVLQKTNTNTTTNDGARKISENRFRKQAESLVQASHVCLEEDTMDTLEWTQLRSAPFPQPAHERAPSPPVRTGKRYPSPVRQFKDDPFTPIATRNQGAAAPIPAVPAVARTESEAAEPSVRTMPISTPLPHRDADHPPRMFITGADGKTIEANDQSASEPADTRKKLPITVASLSGQPQPSNRRDEDSNFRVTQYDRDFHLEGDAATFLYQLVFAGDNAASASHPSSRPGTEDREPDAKSNIAEATDESNNEVGYDTESSDDGLDFSSISDDVSAHSSAGGTSRRRSGRVKVNIQSNRHPATRRTAPHLPGIAPQPAAVVNRLLLEWTDLTATEIEESKSSSTTGNDSKDERDIQDKLADIARESNLVDSDWYEDSDGHQDRRETERIYRGRVPRVERIQEEIAQEERARERKPPRYEYRGRGPFGDLPHLRNPHYEHSFEDNPLSRRPGPYAEYRPSSPNRSADYGYGYNSFPSRTPLHPFANPFNPPFGHGSFGQGINGPYSANQYMGPNGVPQTGSQTMPPYTAPAGAEAGRGSNTKDERRVKQGYIPFRQPNVLVLSEAFDVDLGAFSQTPRIDALERGFTIERQRNGYEWNAEIFAKKYNIEGKAIITSLSTLTEGQNFGLVYTRGSGRKLTASKDLGETWFMNGEPVFLLFYHSSYQPQFFPAREDDRLSRNQEYLSVGEEWISDEAMEQFGISVKDRKNGRVYLDATVTWSTLRELAELAQTLRAIQQRRKYAETFYQPLETFREKHGSKTIAPSMVAEPLKSPVSPTSSNAQTLVQSDAGDDGSTPEKTTEELVKEDNTKTQKDDNAHKETDSGQTPTPDDASSRLSVSRAVERGDSNAERDSDQEKRRHCIIAGRRIFAAEQ
ncbi:hypothetical protein CONLIGDRAFT_708502 [Coniochaeta ligniaria NRRL 30616]|uniref:Fungal N-terminal domain-containing protein n=1 Tax=Coniochaeta ligniaria NRRL 30616 TaxID=1408157 RepID=A0A1J7J7H5_9PEZI|nr:hypothetical protein CONLIGDRAFT_708502 [Coniochaeta ligniaria NRRL 30616]